jgi:hypothetical protein
VADPDEPIEDGVFVKITPAMLDALVNGPGERTSWAIERIYGACVAVTPLMQDAMRAIVADRMRAAGYEGVR